MQSTPIYQVTSIYENALYVKREDLLPFSFGGNKARKGRLFFQEIDRGDYDCVVTYGSSSSNHCRIVSNMAAMRDLPCYVIGPREAAKPTYNQKLMELFGAKCTVVPVEQVHDTIEALLAELRAAGKHPYFIAGGGHGNLGTQAYVDCYEEICRYEAAQKLHFDYIFFATGTGTTQAGLVCGQLLRGDDRRVVGISIARKNPRGRDVVLSSIREYLRETGAAFSEAEIQEKTEFVDGYTGDGYGTDHAAIMKTILEAMRRYGLPLDSTYTGKAFYGMGEYLRTREITGQNVLFIHTGGTPLFFDDLRKL